MVTTVRSQQKADKIKEAHPNVSSKQLGFAIVEDIAKEGAFDQAIKSDPPFEAVIHTASPFHFNVTDVQKVSHSVYCTAESDAYLCIGTPRPSLHRHYRYLEVYQEECTDGKARRDHFQLCIDCQPIQGQLAWSCIL